jgi:hypothetical protein
MELKIISSASTLTEVCLRVDKYFGMSMRIFQIKNSMFEQYDIRPAYRVFIPQIWKYRIIVNKGQYLFGTI